MKLFTRLQPSEQAHALRVLGTLRAQAETDSDLLTAALLHDIGKIRHPLCIWERVIIVLGRKFFPRLADKWGDADPEGFKRPFVVAAQHPAWGADLAQKVAASPLTIQLIREHQNQLPQDRESRPYTLLAKLQAADHQN